MIRENTGRREEYGYRSIWISDAHLGSATCRSADLLDFLKRTHSEHLYILGDFFDKAPPGEPADTDIKNELLEKARSGTRVTYIPGQRDAFISNQETLQHEGIQIRHAAEHITADHRRLLVVHGDEFTRSASYTRLLNTFGWHRYSILLLADHILKKTMHRWARSRNCSQADNRFKTNACYEGRKMKYAGVVCGHQHKPDFDEQASCAYYNTGDWQEHATALVERHDGRMALMLWDGRWIFADLHRRSATTQPAPAQRSPIAATA